jgi:class 3 adenylate cyclase
MIKNLKFITTSAKLLALVLVFITPFIFVTYQLVSEINVQTSFAHKEIIGLTYNQSLRQLLEQFQEYRLLSQFHLAADSKSDTQIRVKWENSRTKIFQSIQEINLLDQRFRINFKTTDKWTAIVRNWQNFLSQESRMTPDQSWEDSNLIITQIISLITHVGDTSNLSFDPVLDSYYLVTALVRHIPNNVDSLDQLRTVLAPRKNIQLTPRERAELLVLYSLSKSSMVEIKRGLEIVFSINPELRPRIGFKLKESLRSNELFVALMNQKIISSDNIEPQQISNARVENTTVDSEQEINSPAIATIDPQLEQYLAHGNQAIAAQYQLYDAIVPALQELLQERIDHLQQRKNQVKLFTLMVLAVFVYIFLSLASNQRKRFYAEQSLRQQQEKTEMLLLNVLPQAIASRLKQGDETIADNFAEVTVLFADIVGFTEISSRMPAQTTVSLLNQIFSAFDYLAEIHGLEKIKTIGDAYMVVGGLPTPRLDHAEAILDMALDMRTAIKKISEELGEDCQIRIGINTGPVVAGVIGIKKFIYDLWGDTVNVASRMESQGIPGEIQVTANTYYRAKSHYKFRSRGTIPVKGKGEMSTYLLLGRG